MPNLIDAARQLKNNSGGGGGYLAYVKVWEETQTVMIPTSSWLDVSPDHRITFTAPSSGNVIIFVDQLLGLSSSGASIYYRLTDLLGVELPESETFVWRSTTTVHSRVPYRFVSEGLTPGVSYTYKLQVRNGASGSIRPSWGGDYGQAIITAEALP